MDKSYFFAMDSMGLLLSLFYAVILIGILAYIDKRMKVNFSLPIITAFFLYYYLFFIVGTFLPWVPDFTDTELFSRIIIENFFPDYQSLGVRLFYGITYPFRVLSLYKLEIFIEFQIFIFMLSLMILWKSWQIVLEVNQQSKDLGKNIFLILAALYPAFLLYIPIPLREFFVLFGFSVMMYGIVDKYYNGKGLLYIALGSLLLLFGRPQLIVIVILFLAMFQKSKWLRYTFIIGSIFLIPLLFSSLMSYKFNPEFFSYLRNRGFDKHGILAYGHVDWHTYWDIMVTAPALVMQFLLSPFPFLHDRNPLDFLAVFIDAVFSFIVYLSVLYAGLKVSKIYLFVLIVSASIFSIWEYHIIGATRHRMPLIAMLLPVASYGMVKFYQDIKEKYDF